LSRKKAIFPNPRGWENSNSISSIFNEKLFNFPGNSLISQVLELKIDVLYDPYHMTGIRLN